MSHSQELGVGPESQRTGLRGLSYAISFVALMGAAAAQCETKLYDGGGSATLAFDGDVVVVGSPLLSPLGSSSGAAHVYERGTGWSELKTLVPSDGAAQDLFGGSVAIHDDTIVIGAQGADAGGSTWAGAVYVFERDAGGPQNWGQVAKLEAPLDYFGWSVSLSGDTLVASAIHDTGSLGDPGAVYIFERDQGGPDAWGQVKEIVAAGLSGNEEFGINVSISGDTIGVGAMFATGTGGVIAGAVFLFERDQGGAGSWGETQKVFSSDVQVGMAFGRSVSLSGDTLAVGCPYGYYNGMRTGTGYVFDRVGGVWGETAKLVGSATGAEDRFGTCLFTSGDMVISGAWQGGPGTAYLYERNEGGPDSWGESGQLNASDGTPGARFGGSVSTSGTTHIVAASMSGEAYAYEPNPQPPTGYCTSGASANGCTAQISASGSPSASASSGFTISVTGIEGQKLGLIFYGIAGSSASPWGQRSSFKCVASPVQRTPLQYAGGTQGSCDGVMTLDWNQFIANRPNALGNPFVGGETLWVQCVYRDPPAPPTTSMSDALVFSVCP